MSKGVIEIIEMSDWWDCDQCGGNSEDGGIVKIDGEVIFEHIPRASCFNNEDISVQDMLIIALEHLGYEVKRSYEDLNKEE